MPSLRGLLMLGPVEWSTAWCRGSQARGGRPRPDSWIAAESTAHLKRAQGSVLHT